MDEGLSEGAVNIVGPLVFMYDSVGGVDGIVEGVDVLGGLVGFSLSIGL